MAPENSNSLLFHVHRWSNSPSLSWLWTQKDSITYSRKTSRDVLDVLSCASAPSSGPRGSVQLRWSTGRIAACVQPPAHRDVSRCGNASTIDFRRVACDHRTINRVNLSSRPPPGTYPRTYGARVVSRKPPPGCYDAVERSIQGLLQLVGNEVQVACAKGTCEGNEQSAVTQFGKSREIHLPSNTPSMPTPLIPS